MTEPEQAAMMQRPKVSPYETIPIALRIGPGKKDYYVAPGLLQNPGWIHAASAGSIQLPDVDENTGHVLVHFLCTGTYQTLDDIGVSPEEEARVEFKRAFSAFVTANTYELAGLQRLAMHNIKQYGKRMTISDIVDAIDEDFSRLSDRSTAFQGYLMTKAKDVFQKEHNSFYNDGMFDRITNVALSNTLAKCVMELYEDKITQMLQAERSTYEVLAKHHAMTDGEVDGEGKVSGDQDTGGLDSKNEESKPKRGPATFDALGNDDGKKKEETTAGYAAGGGGNFPGDGGGVGVGGSGDGGGDKDSVDEDDWGDGSGFKKSKKRLKEEERLAKEGEKMMAKEAEEEAELTRLEEEEAEVKRLEDAEIEHKRLEDEAAAAEAYGKKQEKTTWGEDGWGLVSKTKKKKKKVVKQEPLPPPPPQESVPEPEPGPEPEMFIVPEPVPEPEPVMEEDPWALLTTTSKKKRNKGAKEEFLPPPPPEPEVIPEPESSPPADLPADPPADEWNDWYARAVTKKKKSKKSASAVVVPNPDFVPEDPILKDPVLADPILEDSILPDPSPEPAKSKKEKVSADWGLSSIWSIKKKGRSGDGEPALVQELDGDDDPWGSAAFKVGKKGKKGKKTSAAPDAEPSAEPSAEPTADDDLLDLVKNVPEDVLLPECSDPVPPKKEEAANSWGYARWTSLGSTKTIEPTVEEPVVVEPELEPEPVMEETLVKSSKKKKLSKKYKMVKEEVLAGPPESPPKIMTEPESSEKKESSAKAAAGICPNRVEHLFDGEGWRSCRICRAWLSQVTTELNRTRLVADDGYQIVQ